MANKGIKVVVVGAGIVGLTSATLLQESLPNAQVTIVADKFLTETTSHGAAGIFRPGLNFSGSSTSATMQWLRDSYVFYDQFIDKSGSENAQKAGIMRRRTYLLSRQDSEAVKNFYLEQLVPDFRILSKNEIEEMFPGSQYEYGSTFTTMIIECKKYLPYLTERFQNNGGKLIARKIMNFDELPSDTNLVFNCSGLGSKHLCNDLKMTPIRGQVFKVMAPWLKDAVYVGSDTYIIPGTEGIVTLGGTRQFDSTNVEVDRHDSASIWERCTSILPSLKDAEVVREWVGLRPYRPEVRVEKQHLTLSSGRSVKVIHNYGHGGYGVMSAPGTSIQAVSIGLQELKDSLESKL